MRVWRYGLRRLVIAVPQLFGLLTATFFIIRLLPGDPARLIAGPLASEETVAAIRHQFGLDKPFFPQYFDYLKGLFTRLDLGVSSYTQHPVSQDLVQRFPATFELITLALLAIVVTSVSVGVISVVFPKSWLGRSLGPVAFVYGLVAGALPDFWIGLMLIYFFFFLFHLLPAPVGQIDITLAPPHHLTGAQFVDGLLTANGSVIISGLLHLVLPVMTLAFVYGGPIFKVVVGSVGDVWGSEYLRFARACGLPPRKLVPYAVRSALPPIITLSATMYSFLLAGAVLVETVFSWGGVGQYAVQAISNSDYFAIQGVVLLTGTFTLCVYLLVDLLQLWVDPRIKY